MNAWWEPEMAGWIGGVGGGLVGVLGAALGTLAGLLVPRGKGKPLVLGLAAAMLVAGLVLLVAGVVALALGQPYHVWYPLGLGGLILSVVTGGLLPMLRMQYRLAEQRRMAAEGLRRS